MELLRGRIIVIAAMVFSLGGHASAAVIFGLSGISGPGLDVRAVDFTTGATTALGYMPNITTVTGKYAFDVGLRRYYLVGGTGSSPDKRDTGTLVSSPIIADISPSGRA